MNFKKEFLLDLIYGERPEFFVEDTIQGTSRWSTNHRLIFRADGKFFELEYRRAATEIQDEQPLDDYDNGCEIDCEEVMAVPKTIVSYVKPYKVLKPKVKVPGEGVPPKAWRAEDQWQNEPMKGIMVK